MPRFPIALLTAVFLIGGQSALADANKQKNTSGQGQGGQQQSKGKSGGQSQKGNQQGGSYDQDDDDYSGSQNKGKHKNGNYEQDYDEDYSEIQRAYRENKGKGVGNQGLPPGISKNLQRGKPLPPGIAKRFNSDIERQLPYYPGREWRQVGTDAVLIDSSTQVVQEVMRGVLQ
ncbi:anti-virulence regulator CigR family protein [Pseudomonas sp. N040]|uniref:anti-virulence regulator CigR family protein n=1 Tax=Pseudomonas sp. N040 TaxID=2785325 RepID=UPI0018A32B87|nr:anti-virulence regulator CigR family protein [Pseudomonas sp. N040]MBF7729309.1 hypothetical protein [Pseudomonas sp. N040]MBW7012949.1 hypothetical protein [Pseudomonas sp. N040]